MSHYFIPYEKFTELVKELTVANTVYVPAANNEQYNYERLDPVEPQEIIFNNIRPIESLKSFLYPVNQQVAGTNVDPEQTEKQKIIIGAKACDLKALKILDKVFLEQGGLADPFYAQKRKDVLIISSDCKLPLDTCFCSVIDGQPYPKEGFDINLSPVLGGYVVETGSEKGAELVERHKTFFPQASSAKIGEVESDRNSVHQKIKENNKEYSLNTDYQTIVDKKFDAKAWEKEAENCVSCYGCTNICPSCHCFFLMDTDKKGMAKEKLWDSCHYTGYARVAGGANARHYLYERFRNRYQCKLNYKKSNFDMYACTGCGRCIQVCPGKIDMRKVVKNVNNELQ